MAKPITPIHLPNPAFLGLNKEKASVVQEPSWCIEAQNSVIDGAGRLAARRGLEPVTGSAVASSAPIKQVFEYLQTDGTSIIISTTATQLWSGTSTLTEVTGSVTTPTAGRWQFVNFNGNVYGWQRSHVPIVKITSGNFANLTAATGSVPAGDAACAAFGRIWALSSDKQIIKYCALLDATKWDAADGAGQINMRNVWTKGMDEVVAITAYGSRLIVFGKRHIIMWSDGSGSDIGLDPTTMYVEQSLEGIGCVARDTVAQVGELDVMFWSESGVRSIRRALGEKPTPLNDASGNVRTFMDGVYTTANLDNVRSVYSAFHNMYLLIVPDSNTTMYFDTRGETQDGKLRVCEWPGFVPTAAHAAVDQTVYFGGLGVLNKYFGYDDLGVAYTFEWRMPWNEHGNSGILKHAKEIGGVFLCPDDTTITIKWWTDFKSNVNTSTVALTGGAFAEYNADALYSVAEYSGDITVVNFRTPVEASSEHQFLSIGLSVPINGFPFAIQSASIISRAGRPI